MGEIRPTHHCFDDALAFFHEAGIPSCMVHEFCIVHGICIAPDHHRYAHAWVEHINADVCVQAGYLNGKRILHPMPKAEFYARYRVQEVTRYTPELAMRENLRTCTTGPWLEKYRALCTFEKGTWAT